MKDFLQGVIGLAILAAVAMSMGWIDVPKPLMAMVSQSNASEPDVYAQLKSRMPANQAMLVGVSELAREKYLAAENDMAKGSMRVSRKEELCAFMAPATDGEWFGVVEQLSTNSDGLGVLSIRIAPNITVGTWNNALSDMSSDTLIQPSSPVYKTAVKMKEGDRVRFTGQFFENDVDCIDEKSMTMDGSMRDPEFAFKFASLSPL